MDRSVEEKQVATLGADVLGLGDLLHPEEGYAVLARSAGAAMRSDHPAIAADGFGVGIKVTGESQRGAVGEPLWRIPFG